MKPVFFLMQICPILPGSLANGLWALAAPRNSPCWLSQAMVENRRP